MIHLIFKFLANDVVNLSPLPHIGTGNNHDAIKVIFNILLGVLGALAVLIMTIAGLRLTLSNGDPQALSRAKNTIIYALIGLIIVAFAATIVNFIFSNL